MPVVSYADMNRESLRAVVASLRAMANRYEQLIKEMEQAGIETLPRVPYIEGLRLALERLAKHRDAACSAFDEVLLAALPSDPQKKKRPIDLTPSEQAALDQLTGPGSGQDVQPKKRGRPRKNHANPDLVT